MPWRTRLRIGPFEHVSGRRRPTPNSWGGHLVILALMIAFGVYAGVHGYWELLPVSVGAWLVFVLRNPPGTST